MKNTLRFFLTIIFLSSGISSFAEKKSNDSYVCPTASISYASIKFCTSDTNVQAVNLTGTDAYLGGVFSSMGFGLNLNPATGAITPSSSTPGFYTITYTIPPGPGCPSVAVTTTIEIVAQVNAGVDGTLYVCENNTTPIDLFSIITGEQAGGTWVRTSGAGGTFNAAAGTFTLSPGTTTSSTFSYTLTANAPCVNDSSVATVIVGSLPTGISIFGTTTICLGSSTNLTFTGTPGTAITWTANGGAPITDVIDASGSNVISVSPTATTTYSLLSASLNGCNIPLTQSATVTVNATPQFITQIPDITICNGGMLNIASQLTTTLPGTTFIWSASAANVNMTAYSGDHTNIDQIVNLINTLQTGIINIQVAPIIGSCMGTSQQILVTVKPIPVITSIVADNTEICNNQFVSIITNSNPVATAYNWQVSSTSGVQIVGGVTSGTSVTGIIDLQLALTSPIMAGTISFNLIPVNGICTGAMVMNAVTIIVNPLPNTGTSGSVLVSEASTTPIDLFSIITGEQSGGIWTRISGTDGTFDAGAATFTPELGVTDSHFNYELTNNVTSCENNSLAIINIQPLSSETFIANNIKLSPNPVTDILNIENEFQINSIKIYNQLGQMVFGKEINNNTTQLDLSVINSGIYNVLIETEKGTFNNKIVKK